MRDFRFGSHHGFNLEHYECPRESGLPLTHFETTPWWRYAQRALIVVLVLLAACVAIAR
jgi:hypothetical protein